MFQSKLFHRLFMSYMLIVIFYMLLCILLMVYENTQIERVKTQRGAELQLDQVQNVVEQRISTAQSTVSGLRYSTTMKSLYMAVRAGTQMDSYTLYSIQNEMKNALSQNGTSIYQIVLMVDGSNKVYTSSGTVTLSDTYQGLTELTLPLVEVTTVSDFFSLESNRYSFTKECLIYMDSYTYQNGSSIGTICVLFDLQEFAKAVQSATDDGYGVTISYGDGVLYSQFEEEEDVQYQIFSDSVSGINYTVYVQNVLSQEVQKYYYTIILGTLLISAFFAAVAYRQSRKYYQPIDQAGKLIDTALPEDSDDEMGRLIHGIEELIGEKNVYREKILTITPYAKSGMLHSMISGSSADNIEVFVNEDYLDLIKPYYIVSVVNFAYDGRPMQEEESYRRRMNDLFRNLTERFSTDEIRLVYYFRDIYNVFLITNFETEQKMDELFYQIHKYLSAEMARDFCYVTIGVDIQREDIRELKIACEGAVHALDGILTDGRDMVYFIEEMEGLSNTYYFPANFRERLKNCLEEQDRKGIHELLFEIYKKNYDLSGSPEMYRTLIDEFHLTCVKTLREFTRLNTIHINFQKYTGLATLQDIFDYYDAALISVMDTLQGCEAQDSKLEEDIVAYINTHYTDPDMSLQSLMDRFHASSKYLSLLCKERFGVTYLAYIQDMRIKKAAELIREGQCSLTEICSICGYTNQLTFRRNFKRILGVNPSEYLENMT